MKKLFLIIGLLISLSGFATNYYFYVAGAGTGNSNDKANWYTDTVSWGGGGVAVPGASDNVYFTKAAGSCTCTVNATLTCLNFDCHGWGGTIAGSSSLDIIGTICYLNGTFSNTGKIYSDGISGTLTITSNGKTIYGIVVGNEFGSTQSVTMGDAFNVTNNITVYYGTFNTNGKTGIISGTLSGNSLTNSTITMGSSNITLGSLDFTNLKTFNGNTSTIHIINSSATTAFSGNGKTFYNIYFDGTTGGGIISGSNTFTNLKFAPTASATYQFTNNTTQTITGDFIATGSGSITITIRSTANSGTIPVIQSSAKIGCSNDYVADGVTNTYYGVSFAQVGGVGSGYLGSHSSISTGTGAPINWNLTVCPGVSTGNTLMFGTEF